MWSRFKFDMLGEVLQCGLILRLRNVIVGICNRQAGTRLPCTRPGCQRCFRAQLLTAESSRHSCLSVSVVARSPLATGQRASAGSCMSQALPSINQTCQFKRHSRLCSKGPRNGSELIHGPNYRASIPSRENYFSYTSQRSERFVGVECNGCFFIGGVKWPWGASSPLCWFNNKEFCVLHVQSNTTIFYLLVQ